MSIDSVDGQSTGATATLWRGDHPVYDRIGTVCVVGAGASGLAAVKNLRECGFAVDCYERETGVAGAWNWRHDRSPVHAGTHLVTSRPVTEFPDFPMPDDWPDYPHHSLVHGYLERYADHFGLREHLWFGTEVVRVEPADDDTWDVTTRVGQRERTSRYSAVVVANGHTWSPKLPSYDGIGRYRGEVIHSSAYKDPAQLRGRKVLVVGAGDSGVDIAVDAATQAAACWHSTRRGYWHLPKFVRGAPIDQVHARLLRARAPLRLRQWLAHRYLRRTVGDLTPFGVVRPDHRVFETHPGTTGLLVHHVRHGAIRPVPDVARFERSTVVVGRGDAEQVLEPDLVVLATGYLPRFEFLAPELLDVDQAGRPRLHLHAFARRHPTLAVAGLVQPDTGLFPIVHWQTVLLARWLRLRERDPGRAAAFWRQVANSPDRRWTRAATVDSTRHWFEVSHADYLRALQKTLTELESS